MPSDSRDSRAWFLAPAIVGVLVLAIGSARGGSPAERLLADAGVKGGLVVHVGCGDGRLTAALRANERVVVQGLDRDPANVAKAREHIQSLGVYGPVSADHWTGAPRLPYADNLVNLIVASGKGQVSSEDIARVLAPRGRALIAPGSSLDTRPGRGRPALTRDTRSPAGLSGWTLYTKPVPRAIDEWTHTLHDATNNAVADDTVVAPPRRTHWIAEPRNARHHESLASVTVVVSAGGRLFSIIDEAPTASVLLRPEWALVARDAFSGIGLWKRPIPTWESHLRGFRSGPPELSRRLVASADRVYVTLGLDAPLTALDTTTGETVKTYDGTQGTEEIRLSGGVLYLVVRGSEKPGAASAVDARTKPIVALRAETGELIWEKTDARPLPTTVAIGGGRLAYLDDKGVVALDAKTGHELWRQERVVAVKRPGWSAATLVIHDDVVLCADRQAQPASTLDESTGKKVAKWLADDGYPGDLIAYAADTGKELWRCRAAEAYHAPIDVFVIDGAVWVGQSRARTGPDFTMARDLHTGKIVRRIAPDRAFKTTMPHHRCHRNRATRRFIVAGRTGVEFIDLASGEGFRHHWVRGTCQFGTLPCNGLLYAPPHSCACYIEAKLTGFLALAPAARDEGRGTRGEGDASRLVKGPAYGSSLDTRHLTLDTSADWPTYRHDAARSGCTGAVVPAELSQWWRAKIGGRISSPVFAYGLALVAAIDAHTVHALDAMTGQPAWSYTAGGRIDSPPTVSRGLAVFGAADGYVHCVRVADGELVWRLRVAPADRRIVAFEQVESAWPVHGSVLVTDGVVTCAAGRTSYLDGGITLHRIDLSNGKALSEQRLDHREPSAADQPDEPIMFEMPGALSDVLSTDGGLLYMRRLAFDPATLEPRKAKPHLYSPAGFLNGEWWHRTYWIYGDHFYSGYIGWFFAGHENAAGRLLSVSDSTIYGFGYKPSFYRGSREREYCLYATDKSTLPDPGPPDYQRANRDYPHGGGGKFKVKYTWQRDVPLLARAMVLAKDTLFLAGPPASAGRSVPAFKGERGGVLSAVAAADGKTRRDYGLDALPVHDGMAATQGRLFLSLTDGSVLCLGAKRPGSTPLPALAAPGTRPLGKPKEPGLVGHWTLDEGVGPTAKDSSGVGNDAEMNGRWVKGAFGTCVSTQGSPGALTLWDNESLRFGTGDFSLELWVKAERFDRRLLGKEDFPRNWWVINILANGKAELVLGTGTGAGKSVRLTAKTPLAKNGWTHLVFVVDRKATKVTWFVNGALDSTTPIAATLGGFDVKGKALRIPSAHKPFAGLVDEIRLYRRSLTAAEVRASFDREKPKRAPAK